MNRLFPRWVPAVALAAYVCAASSNVRARDGAANDGTDSYGIDRGELTRRLTQWRSSFVNLRVVWELRSLPESHEPMETWPPPGEESGKLFSRYEWIWADHGLDLLDDHSFFYEDGSSKIHRLDAFNGPRGVAFRASFRKPPDGPEQYKELHLHGLGVGKPISRLGRAPVRGLYWSSRAAWLPELLTTLEWKFEGIENIRDEPCARMSSVPDGGALTETVWLGMNHDYLVRRCRTASVSPAEAVIDQVVDEYQRLGADIWFPKRGRIQLGGGGNFENQLFVVTEAAVNQQLDLGRFDPPAPQDGTVVDDHGNSYIHGGSSLRAAQPIPANTVSEIPSQPPSAAPPQPRWFWSPALAGMSLILLVVGLWFSSRRGKEHQS